MHDITMCDNNTCPMRERCYRFTETYNVLQWYATFKPDENDECNMFLEIEK